jgi:hypothetical protein
VSAEKLLAWVDSQLSGNEDHIAWEMKNSQSGPEWIRELEGRKWAYKLIKQFLESGCADEEGAVCGACGGTKAIVVTGYLVCSQCYEFRCSECSMVPASSAEGQTALQSRRLRQKAGVPEDQL